MNKKKQKIKRQIRVRKRIRGTGAVPRLSVFRSNKHIYAQLIDDASHKTIAGVSEKHVRKENISKNKIEQAKQIGLLLAKKAGENKIEKVVFDKGSYAYHGIIKSIAEGAREGGLQF